MPDFADLEQAGGFERALSTVAEQREIIFAVSDKHMVRWVHNLHANLAGYGLERRLLTISESPEACALLLARVRVGCGHSSYLRSAGGSGPFDHGLKAWRIARGHVYHLWWQRWHYFSRAVALGYRPLSLDLDISLRANPYPLLHTALTHRLILGLDHSRADTIQFPAINVGFAYCTGAPGGTAHNVIQDVVSRFERFLQSEPLRAPGGRLAQQVLWEQDTWKDAIETSAFRLPPNSSRHALIYAGETSPELARHVATFSWFVEQLDLGVGSRSRALSNVSSWLPLHGTASESRATDTLGTLPQWFFAAYHHHNCVGAWAQRPSPVVIGHLAGAPRAKAPIARLLGWWHYEADREAFQRTTFPPDTRVLVMRGHGLQLRPEPGRLSEVHALMSRWMVLAAALGRRAVLPTIPCPTTPSNVKKGSKCVPALPPAMAGAMLVVPLNDPTLCEASSNLSSSNAWRRQGDIRWEPPTRPSDADEGRRSVCCQYLPTIAACVNPYGRDDRPLHQEPALLEPDLAQLLAEDPEAATAAVHKPLASLVGLDTQERSSWKLARARFEALRNRTINARVLVIHGDGNFQLPSMKLLIRLFSSSSSEELMRQTRQLSGRCVTKLAALRLHGG